MPRRQPTHCSPAPGSSNEGDRYRAENKAIARKIRNSSRWQKKRASLRRRFSVCIDPLGLHPAGPQPTQEIHHIVAVVDDPRLAFDEDNLAPLCLACHQTVEAKTRSGQRLGPEITAAWQQARAELAQEVGGAKSLSLSPPTPAGNFQKNIAKLEKKPTEAR